LEKAPFIPVDETKNISKGYGDTTVCVRLRPILNFEKEKGYYST